MRPTLTAALLLIVTLALYAPVVAYGFVYEDRNDFQTWSQPFRLASIWEHPTRSLTGMTYAVGRALSGYEAWGYHLVSVLLHGLNGVLFALLAFDVIGGWGAVFALGVFLLHPVQVESVAYISSQADVVSTACLLVALLLAERGKLLLALLCCGLAVLGKETAVAGFLLIPAWHWMRGRGVLRGWLVISALPAVLLLDRFPVHLDPAWMAATVKDGIGLLSLWLFPVPLTIYHDWSAVRIAVSLGVIVALVIVSPAARLALVCAVALWLPRLFVPQLEGMHEHHLYTVSIGLSLCAGFWLRTYAQEANYGIPETCPQAGRRVRRRW